MKLVDLPTAKALQELGYDGEYSKMYSTSNQLIEIDEIAKPYCIPAPRLDDVAYFLRDKYRITIEPMWGAINNIWSMAAYNMDYRGVYEYFHVEDFSYDTALEAAVAKAIEIINSRNKSERESDENKRNR